MGDRHSLLRGGKDTVAASHLQRCPFRGCFTKDNENPGAGNDIEFLRLSEPCLPDPAPGPLLMPGRPSELPRRAIASHCPRLSLENLSSG